MKKLICGLALALGLLLSCHAQGMKISAYPNTNNLAGTNLFLIAIVGSPGTNMNISYAQLSNLLAAAIGGGGGGAQEWTNAAGFVYLSGHSPSNGPAFRTNDGAFFSGHPSAADVGQANYAQKILFDAAMGDDPAPNFVFESWADYANTSTNRFSHYFNGSTTSPFVGYQMSYQDYNGVSETWDWFADNDVYSQFIFTKSGGGVIDGSCLIMAPNFDGTTFSGVTTAYKLGTSLIVNSNDLFQVHNAGTNMMSVDYLGIVKSSGSFYPSNAVPAIPSGATLGAGGYWTGNSNGFLVTVYSLDGSSTVMKVLAP